MKTQRLKKQPKQPTPQWINFIAIGDQFLRLALMDLSLIQTQMSLDEVKFEECCKKIAEKAKPSPKPKSNKKILLTTFGNFQ